MFTDSTAFCFHKPELIVSDPSYEKPLRFEDELRFSLFNPAGVRDCLISGSNSKVVLRLMVDKGNGSNAMFSNHDEGGYGTIVCPKGFRSEGWQPYPGSQTRLYCDIKVEDGFSLTLGVTDVLNFTWKHIVSTSAEGFCTVIVDLLNHGNLTSRTLCCEIFKRRSGLRITKFEASPSTGYQGSKLTLKWQVSNAVEGRILPGNYNIFKEGPQSSSSLDVTLDDAEGYYIYVANNDYGELRRVDVFAMPPVITEFGVSNGRLAWKTRNCSGATLTVNGQSSQVEPSGDIPTPENVTTAMLLCSNSKGTLRRYVHISQLDEIIYFAIEVEQFAAHNAARIIWHTAGLSELILLARGKDAVRFIANPSGEWEQVYNSSSNFAADLNYTRQNGEKGSVRIVHESNTLRRSDN